MKAITIILSVLFLTLLSCNKDDENDPNEVTLTSAEIPVEIKSYVGSHFGSSNIIRAVKGTEKGAVNYAIYLSGNVELEFDSTYKITDIDGRTQLPDSVIPTALLDYVKQKYPNQFITDWELELDHQQVELNNGIELEFAMNGDFLRIDKD